MSAGLDTNRSRRAARLVATLGLCVGGICLLAGAGVYLGTSPDVPPTALAEMRLPLAAKDLILAAVAVLGTILVSVGAVFALLDRIGVLAAVTEPRQDVEALEPRHELPAPEARRGDAAPTRSDPAEVRVPVPDQGAGPSGAGHTGPGAFPSRGAARDAHPDARTGYASHLDTPGVAPSVTGAPSDTRTAGLAPEGADGAELEVQPSKPGASATEAAAPQLVVGEPPPAQAPQPGDLIAAWDDYRRAGDGHFSRRGFQAVLAHRGLAADVSAGDRVGAGDAVLIVERPSGAPRFYVLPNFNKSPRAVADWFDDDSGGALTGRTQRVTRVAQGRWVEPGSGIGRGFEVLERGEIA